MTESARIVEIHEENIEFRENVTLSARKSNTKIMERCTEVAEIPTQRSDSRNANEIPMFLHGFAWTPGPESHPSSRNLMGKLAGKHDKVTPESWKIIQKTLFSNMKAA